MASHSAVLLKRRLDEMLQDPAAWVETPDAADRPVVDATVAAFRAASAAILDEATPHLWAYYRSVAEAFDHQQRLEYGIPELAVDDDLWAHVELVLVVSYACRRDPLMPDPCYLAFEGEVPWEAEHGLGLVFAGGRICKLGPCDGHMTNAHAYADESLLGVVFRG